MNIAAEAQAIALHVRLVAAADIEVDQLFALRESRRGNWRQALGGLEAQMCGGSEARRI